MRRYEDLRIEEQDAARLDAERVLRKQLLAAVTERTYNFSPKEWRSVMPDELWWPSRRWWRRLSNSQKRVYLREIRDGWVDSQIYADWGRKQLDALVTGAVYPERGQYTLGGASAQTAGRRALANLDDAYVHCPECESKRRDWNGMPHPRYGTEAYHGEVYFRDRECWMCLGRGFMPPLEDGPLVPVEEHEQALIDRGLGPIFGLKGTKTGHAPARPGRTYPMAIAPGQWASRRRDLGTASPSQPSPMHALDPHFRTTEAGWELFKSLVCEGGGDVGGIWCFMNGQGGDHVAVLVRDPEVLRLTERPSFSANGKASRWPTFDWIDWAEVRHGLEDACRVPAFEGGGHGWSVVRTADHFGLTFEVEHAPVATPRHRL
jgi:hypothetical protein